MNTPGQASKSILTAQRGDMCYCPGCSHATILEHLGSALQRMSLQPRDVCIVSDIGCIGTADKYFACHTFHGLHGRSITYAEGIKRVHPEMTVIVLIGDGGCGIGTAHLVHGARRNVGIKVIVCNNFNFGMTGGQHSPTTPPCMLTPTTPDGARERPFDICQTVIANGAGHVARQSALDPHCSDYIEALLRASGFGLIDLWELCVAYFVPENKLKPSALQETSQRLNLPFGLLSSRTGLPTNSPATLPPRAASPQGASKKRVSSSLRWPRRIEICVAGSAGQRIRSAAAVIGEIAVGAGLYAAQQDDFPITVRKGHSISQLIISDRPIRYTGVDDPELVILLSTEGAARLRAIQQPGARCQIVTERQLNPSFGGLVRRIDLGKLEKQSGKASAALVALVAGLNAAGWVDASSLLEAAHSILRGPYREDNLRAIEHGTTLGFEADFAQISTGQQEATT